MVHFERNVLAHVPHSQQQVVAKYLKEVFSVK